MTDADERHLRRAQAAGRRRSRRGEVAYEGPALLAEAREPIDGYYDP